MDAGLKKAWIDALKSGKYQQGSDYLANDGKYCCLGVLAEITGNLATDSDSFHPNMKRTLDSGSAKFPSSDLCEVWRLDYGVAYDLAVMNDERVSFTAIATYIEKNVTED